MKTNKRILVMPADGNGTRISKTTNNEIHKMCLPYSDKLRVMSILEYTLETIHQHFDFIFISVNKHYYENVRLTISKFKKREIREKIRLYIYKGNSMIDSIYYLLNKYRYYEYQALIYAPDNLVYFQNKRRQNYVIEMFQELNTGFNIDLVALTFKHPHPERFGVYNYDTKEMVEKPQKYVSSDVIPAIYAIKNHFVRLFKGTITNPWSNEPDIINNVIKKVNYKFIKVNGQWTDVGTPDDYKKIWCDK